MDGMSSVEPDSRVFNVVGFSGSLRRASFNSALLRAATELAPPRLRITTYELHALPHYNADLEASGVPSTVLELREAVRQSDGLLIATPEYNHGIPGVLKNAIDWLSRPPRSSCLSGKPAAIMGASAGVTGTARCQEQLRQVLVATNTYTLLRPEVLVGHADTKIDADGQLTDQATRDFLAKFLDHFVLWIARFATS